MTANNIASFSLRRVGSIEDVGQMYLDDTTEQDVGTVRDVVIGALKKYGSTLGEAQLLDGPNPRWALPGPRPVMCSEPWMRAFSPIGSPAARQSAVRK